ncbi:MAG: transcriptional regulator NrdR [Candidatus Woesearchaeota archaeon]
MKCPYCSSEETKVLDKRDLNHGEAVRRRRACNGCEKRFTTYERIGVFLTVIKKDGQKEPYTRLKILNGIKKACEKRPIDENTINDITESIEAEIFRKYSMEVNSRAIGNIVIRKLKRADEVAYVRFASVYREFDDINSFTKEVGKLTKT